MASRNVRKLGKDGKKIIRDESEEERKERVLLFRVPRSLKNKLRR